MSKMPAQKPGKSEQVVCTPPEFLRAVRNRFAVLLVNGDFSYDLAASPENAIATPFYTEADDSLIQPWHTIKGLAWCNPPFGDIEPWVAKAQAEAAKGAEVAMLLPASVGANWWRSFVDQKAWAFFLNGRLTFVGHTSPYPKDLALLIYLPRIAFFDATPNYNVWNWRLDQ